jgi:predicted nicotinamide N-methyase
MSLSSTLADDELEASLRSRFAVVEEAIDCAGRTFQVLHPRSADEIICEQEFNEDERLPYWAEIWPSARVLAERLPPGHGTLLELGSGCGYVALVAAQLGYDVLATDYYQPACEFVCVNAARHQLANIAPRLVNWRSLPDDLGRFDRVIAADVLYERDYCELVAGVLARTLAGHGRAIVTDPGRERAARFLECCAAVGLTGQRVERVPYNDGVNRPFVDVYELSWKGDENVATADGAHHDRQP